MISCFDYTKKRKDEIKQEISEIKTIVKPCLAVVQIGNDPASTGYVNGKRKDASEVGMEFLHIHIEDYESISEYELIKKIIELNNDSSIHGIIIQLPIPEKYDINKLLAFIDPIKDVDGFRVDTQYVPCTVKGILDWLDINEYDLEGKVMTIIGRSNIVGKPLMNEAVKRRATVISCNRATKESNLKAAIKMSDVVVVAAGAPKFFGETHFMWSYPDIVIDVGIHKTETGWCGDVDRESIEEDVIPRSYITPVPKGVGLLTRLALVENTFTAFKNRP